MKSSYKVIKPNKSIPATDLVLGAGFFFSALNQYLAYGIFVVFLLYFSIHRDRISMLKAFSLYVLRVSSMNPLIFQNSTNGAVRNALLLGYAICSIVISRVQDDRLITLKKIAKAFAIYYVYLLFNSLFVSTYPVVSTIKLILYGAAFFGAMCLVASETQYPWIKYFTNWYTMIMLLCLIVIPIGSLRIRNGHAFQGVFGHPNVFGIVASAYVCLVLASNMHKWKKFLMITLTLYMQYLSGSRTGLFSAVIIIGLYVVLTYRKSMSTMLFVLLVTAFCVVVALVLVPTFASKLTAFFWKSSTGDLLHSRSGQIDRFMIKFETSPIFGTGFMVPYDPSNTARSFELLFDLYVEDGNLFFSVIGQTGIVGLLLFIIAYGRTFLLGNRDRLYLFIAPILISSGEMVFFSTNSLGFLLYVFYAIYVFCPKASPLMKGGGDFVPSL